MRFKSSENLVVDKLKDIIGIELVELKVYSFINDIIISIDPSSNYCSIGIVSIFPRFSFNNIRTVIGEIKTLEKLIVADNFLNEVTPLINLIVKNYVSKLGIYYMTEYSPPNSYTSSYRFTMDRSLEEYIRPKYSDIDRIIYDDVEVPMVTKRRDKPVKVFKISDKRRIVIKNKGQINES